MGEGVGAAAGVHAWLERTAFFKVPRCLQEEAVAVAGRPFEEVPSLLCRCGEYVACPLAFR